MIQKEYRHRGPEAGRGSAATLLEMHGFPSETTFAGRLDFLARITFHPDDRRKWEQAVAPHFAGPTVGCGFGLCMARGETRWFHLTRLCFRNASAVPVRWRGAVTDATERKPIEEALQLALERYARAMEASDEGHWIRTREARRHDRSR
jgi:PAS domain-containing protein